MIGIARWAVALVVGLALFLALGSALADNASGAVTMLAALGVGVATLGVLAYVVRSLVRGPRYRN